MSRPLAPLLLFLVAGCAGGDLMRGDSQGSSLADDEQGTGGAVPVMTGLTGLSTGESSTGDGTTIPQAATDADSDPSAESGTNPSDTEADGSSSRGDAAATDAQDTDAEDTDGSDNTDGSTTGIDVPDDAVDLSGWTVVQTGSDRTFVLPAGTVLPAGALLVLGRDASRGGFETHWGSLGDEVLYLDTEGAFPAINGDETFSLRDPSDAVIDGPTPAIQSGESMARDDVAGTGTWTARGESEAAPGIGHVFAGIPGVFITEVSDATGSGSYVYEFVELQAWP